jgi:hypothetical protein
MRRKNQPPRHEEHESTLDLVLMGFLRALGVFVARFSSRRKRNTRWRLLKLRVDQTRDVSLFQQGTFAPESAYRWMASAAIDKRGNIGIGYSFGAADRFTGQRFAARLADDPPGLLTFRESVLAEGEAAQTNTLRWEDYSQTAVDPADDCTIWYVGDYFTKDAPTYSTRIGAFRMPGCS